jgi:nicotinamide-nucleotide amidase
VNASIIAIGSEMLGPTRVDTNSLKITAALEDFGVAVARKSIVGDRQQDLVDEMRYCVDRSDILITTGGLGPTEDDLTREALTEAFGLKTEVDQSIIERIEKRFAARGWKMPEVNKRQANVFTGQTTLKNERGTAPAFHIQVKSKDLWVFPGVPHELEWMLETYFVPWLRQKVGPRKRYRRVLKVVGLTESLLEEKLKPYYDAHNHEPLTILSSGAQIEMHLQSDGNEAEAKAAIASREKELLEIFAEKIYGFDNDSLEAIIGSMLIERNASVSVAESCTGGLLSSRITDVAGSSAYFMGGAVCYTADAKMFLAGVDPALIQQFGEVSEQVAVDLAKGVRRRFHTTYGIGVTGIAGPGGGSEAKPVGTVHIAVADLNHYEHRRLFWPMTRAMFKWFATQSALDLLRLTMLRATSTIDSRSDSGSRIST